MSNTNTCERNDDLVGFLYGELSELETRKFERHLHECAACKAELNAFGEIRQSLVDWRNESLGLAALPAVSVATLAPAHPAKSALAAVREFFTLSPLWMKGATAFAAVLFCVCAVLAIGYLKGQQPVMVDNSKVYSESELQARLAAELQKSHSATTATAKQEQSAVAAQPGKRSDRPPVIAPQKSGAAGVARNRNARRPFTQQERQELAADLRLVSSKDDDDLDLVIDASRPTP